MAITIDWGTKVINIPQADLTLIGPDLYELDVDVFRLALKDLEDSEDGMYFDTTHNHNAPVTVGGVTLARVVEIINGYTITFEDGVYAVNIVGANNNVSDVTNVNSVSLRTNNTAGLIQVDSGGGGSTDWTAGERAQIRHRLGIDGAASAPLAVPSLSEALLALANGVEANLTFREFCRLVFAATAGKSSGGSASGASNPKFQNRAQNKNRIDATVDADGNRTAVTYDTSD